MSREVLDHWWPVTYDFGLIRAGSGYVAETRRKAYAASGGDILPHSLSAPLQECFSSLLPLSPAPTKELFLAAAPGWTVFFSNGCRGSDPALPMKQISQATGAMTLRICVTPQEAMYQSVILEVFDRAENGGDRNGHRRSIATSNDGGRWVFEQSGAPFAFEDGASFEARRKQDRLTPAILARYLECLGAPLLTDAVLQPGGIARGVLLARPAHDHLPRYTLAEAKRV